MSQNNPDLSQLFTQLGLNFGDLTKGMAGVAKEFKSQATPQNFPNYYLVDVGEHYLYNFELPGYQKDNVTLARKGNSLHLSGVRVRDLFGGTMLRDESNCPDDFNREVTLANDCDQIVEASFQDGMLTVKISKVAEEEEVVIS